MLPDCRHEPKASVDVFSCSFLLWQTGDLGLLDRRVIGPALRGSAAA